MVKTRASQWQSICNMINAAREAVDDARTGITANMMQILEEETLENRPPVREYYGRLDAKLRRVQSGLRSVLNTIGHGGYKPQR